MSLHSSLIPVSAYIPCYNHAKTLAEAIEGIRRQTHPISDLFVVDDGSVDGSVSVAENMGVRVIRMETNQGRGSVRFRAMKEAKNEFVLCCDATNELPAEFLETALAWFASEKVVGVFGRYCDRRAKKSVMDRWRARHLFKQNARKRIQHGAFFATYGAVVRRSSVLAAGNFNPALRHGEDFDLGLRLRSLGDVILDPALEVQPLAPNMLLEVMERYTRWNRASLDSFTITDFIDCHKVAWKILIPRDLEERDWLSMPISMTMPYFSLFFADKRSLRFASHSERDAKRRVAAGHGENK